MQLGTRGIFGIYQYPGRNAVGRPIHCQPAPYQINPRLCEIRIQPPMSGEKIAFSQSSRNGVTERCERVDCSDLRGTSPQRNVFGRTSKSMYVLWYCGGRLCQYLWVLHRYGIDRGDTESDCRSHSLSGPWEARDWQRENVCSTPVGAMSCC